MTNTRSAREARRLTAVWRSAIDASSRDPHGSQKLADAEEAAYDALVNFVDDNDLTWTEYDPRGTREEYDAAHPED